MLSLFIQASLKLKPRSNSRRCILSYPSLKCILEHLEANKRFQLASRCPAIRLADKQTPLHINYLVFNLTHIIVNDTKYQMGIYRHFPENNTTPVFFKNINNAGGASYDLDRFGRDDWEPENVLTPGDIATSNPMPIWRNRTDAAWNDYVGNSYRRLDELKNLQETSEIRNEKDKLKAAVFSVSYAQLDDPVPFETLLQLTVFKGSNTLRRELMEGTAKMREAMKYLLGKFLGERAFPIRVKTLDISPGNAVIRLPLGVQFHVQNLYTTAHFAHVLGFPIFDPRSFPLHNLDIKGDHPFEIEENHEHPVIQNAKVVVLRPQNTNLDGNWFDIAMKYRRNQHVQLKRCNFSIQQFLMIVNMIIEDQREIGTQYSFGSSKLNILEEVIVELSQRPNAEIPLLREERRAVILPMNTTSCLLVYVESRKDFYDNTMGNYAIWIQVKSKSELDALRRRCEIVKCYVVPIVIGSVIGTGTLLLVLQGLLLRRLVRYVSSSSSRIKYLSVAFLFYKIIHPCLVHYVC